MIEFFLGTKLGRSIGLVAILALAVFATYKIVDHRAYARGEAVVQARWDAAKAEARAQAGAHNTAQVNTGMAITNTAATKAADVHASVDKSTSDTKKVIEYVYRDPPATPPVRPGACSHPLDNRVQQRLKLGVDQARSAGR